MSEALRLAEKALFTTSPNPRVGCVIVKDNEIIGRGFHEKAGESHAEVIALKEAGSQSEGSDVYVTLEPCSHTGKTPPCVDALIDLHPDAVLPNENFLMEMLTGMPNYLKHYNHIGFQSYYVHPIVLETLDKLRFDCYRVGNVKEALDEMEPVIRNSHLFSFDMSALGNAYSPASTISPNGLTGEEACALFRYAGMSPTISTVGIYGYNPHHDQQELSAKQIAQQLWYLLDGRSRGKREASLTDKDSFNEYYMAFAEVETVFLQSKKTGRWWMQLPDKKFIACSYKDYLLASSNEIPERWLRAQERS